MGKPRGPERIFLLTHCLHGRGGVYWHCARVIEVHAGLARKEERAQGPQVHTVHASWRRDS